MLHFTVALNSVPCLRSGKARGAELGRPCPTEPETRRLSRRPRMLFGTRPLLVRPLPGSGQRLLNSYRASKTTAVPPRT